MRQVESFFSYLVIQVNESNRNDRMVLGDNPFNSETLTDVKVSSVTAHIAFCNFSFG
jgi:hypothetical protein